MEWILEKLPVLIFIVVFVVQLLRAVGKARAAKAEHEKEQRDSLSEERRVREIQEQIRRRIAERRGGAAPAPAAEEPPVVPAGPRPEPRPETTQLPDIFGGPLRRVLEELEKKAQPPPAPPPLPRAAEQRAAELERQQELAAQMKALEEARALAQRRAAHLAEQQRAESQAEGTLLASARRRLLADLREPESLRRAFLVREVLGPPVGLR